MFCSGDPACGCRCSHAFVGENEYQGIGGKGVLELHGAWGGGKSGLGGLVGGWARLTKSSPNESDLLSDSGIWRLLNGTGFDCVKFDSFAGNWVSSNFTSWEISKCWLAVSQNWYPLDPGL